MQSYRAEEKLVKEQRPSPHQKLFDLFQSFNMDITKYHFFEMVLCHQVKKILMYDASIKFVGSIQDIQTSESHTDFYSKDSNSTDVYLKMSESASKAMSLYFNKFHPNTVTVISNQEHKDYQGKFVKLTIDNALLNDEIFLARIKATLHSLPRYMVEQMWKETRVISMTSQEIRTKLSKFLHNSCPLILHLSRIQTETIDKKSYADLSECIEITETAIKAESKKYQLLNTNPKPLSFLFDAEVEEEKDTLGFDYLLKSLRDLKNINSSTTGIFARKYEERLSVHRWSQ